jgi:hypothetical protein
MRSHFVFAGLVTSVLAVACSSTASAPKNVSTDGKYAFDGDGWTHMTSSSEYWTKGSLKLVGSDEGSVTSSNAEEWAKDDYDLLVSGGPSGPPSLLAPTKLGSSGGYWFGWYFKEDGVNVYESFFMNGKQHVNVEISGPALSETDAAAVLSTVQIL